MKKIITALTLGALIGTAAFADVEVSLNFRQRANIYTANDAGGNKSGTFFTDAYSGSGTDNLNFNLSGDIAAFETQLVSDAATGNAGYIRAKKLALSLFLGNLTLQAGTWADGLSNGAYRTKTDVDAGNLEGMDFEWKKMGSGFARSPAAWIDNPVNHSQNGPLGEFYAAGANYNIKFNTGAVALKGFYVSNETSTTTSQDGPVNGDGSWQGHQFNFIVDARQDDIGQAELAFKVGQTIVNTAGTGKAVEDKYPTALAFGAYLQPKIIQPLILTFGGTGAVIDSKFTDYSFDLRARYQVIPKKLSISSFHSFSGLTSDGEDVYALSVSGKVNETIKGLADSGTAADGKLGGTAIKRDKVMSNNIMVRYNVNDTLSLIGIAADMIGFGTNLGVTEKNAKGDGDAGALVQLRFSGWAQFFAASNASVSVGLVCAIHDATNYKDVDGKASVWTWGVPVILRVKF